MFLFVIILRRPSRAWDMPDDVTLGPVFASLEAAETYGRREIATRRDGWTYEVYSRELGVDETDRL